LPEEAGGAGYGASALGVVAHELGRVLAPVPFLASTVLANDLLIKAGGHEVASRLATGERTAAAAITGNGGLWDPSAVTLTAEQHGAKWTVDGTARHVLNGTGADDLVIVAISEGRPAIFVVDAAAAAHNLIVEPEHVLDGTRPMATLVFSAASATRLGGDGPVDQIIERSIDLALAVLSAEQVGACERVLEIATEYARTREQFGRPIGSFQAVKHRCADMLVDLEWARSASQAALQSVDEDDGESGWRASMAKALCSEALRDASHSNVQVHGGIGFTWEGSAGLYVRRARTDEVLFGGVGQHWDQLAVRAQLL
jgi:alkylation response protein AidB-like acyl-CoA dehydrogenase